jgi:predicted nucleic acid-binding protein
MRQERIFLDANVLFSAAWRPGNGLLELWRRSDSILMSSAYAIAEAERNLDTPEQGERLRELCARLVVVPEPGLEKLPREARALPEKDWPILAAAVQARAGVLLTGDRMHFGPFFGARLCGVMVLRPREFLQRPGARGSP